MKVRDLFEILSEMMVDGKAMEDLNLELVDKECREHWLWYNFATSELENVEGKWRIILN